MSEIIVSMKQIQKRFPGVHALDDAQITLHKGEVHGLVGENGAGKSTLMKILTGIYGKDSGSIVVKGREVNYLLPSDAISDGISMIHQELNLMPHMSVSDNIYIGREPMRGLTVDEDAKYENARKILDSLHLDIDPDTKVNRLSVAKQQMVEIAKALSLQAEVMIMDEPTAALTNSEIDELFGIIRSMRSQGVSIVYISHRMDELKRITDEITVMRDGQYVGTVKTAETDIDTVISMMVGRVIYETPKTKNQVPQGAPVVLRAEHLSSAVVKNVSFELKKGEILGFAGLMGAGRTETARLVFGADPRLGGKIYVHEKEVDIHSPEDAVRSGIGYLSEDRKAFGLAVGLSVADNVILSTMDAVTRFGIVLKQKVDEMAQRYVDKINIKTPSLVQIVRNLSGGNQQKVVIAKWLAKNSEILIFDEPTRGIDVGAKSEIYKLMNQLASEGKSIIMISSELPELLRMSDRIMVMCEGRMTGEPDISEASQESIMHYATLRN